MTISTRAAIASSVTGRYLIMALQFASTMVLARLLTPEDIGIYTAGFSVVALAHLFRDFGLNQYIIQEQNLDETAIRTTFTLSLMIAWALGLVVFLLADPAARFFGEPGVKQLLQLLSINFFLIPFGSVTLAILRKKMLFHITAGISFVAVFLGISVAVYSAYTGQGFMCLAYGAVTETSATVILSAFFRPKRMSFLPSIKGARRIFQFASIVGTGNVVMQLSYSITDALIARMLGITALGFFSRAWGTFELFNNIFVNAFKPVMLPLLSRNSGDQPKLIAGYSQAVCYSFIFAWPFFAFLYLYTFEVMRVLYGAQWDAAIPLVKILCAAGFTLPVTIFVESLFIACGKPGTALKLQLIANAAKVTFVLVACFIGLKAVSVALVGYFFVRLLTSMYYAQKVVGIRYSEMAKVALQAIPSLITTIAPTLLAYELVEGRIENVFLRFFILASLAATGWLIGLKLGKHPFFDELTTIYQRILRRQSIEIK
tara:strand:+ start:24398 stop:25858 length:1461 start_codon:yes stop_codon:yes gene_type:complete